MPKRKLPRLDKGLGDLAREVTDHKRETQSNIRKAVKKMRWKLKGIEERRDELKKQDPRNRL